ncbi:MAG: hypothetical protein V1709_08430 [Planctomycetota bacterium]
MLSYPINLYSYAFYGIEFLITPMIIGTRSRFAGVGLLFMESYQGPVRSVLTG